ncbi:MAG TPA: acyl-CoA dehydrogenase family protein [Deltaproteobacteria bacterium]|nr:acyl-CoA dehydrogenase family protein [Deltaproteobacteria bacterium]
MLTTFKTDLKPFEDLANSFAAKELTKKVEEHDKYPFGEFFTGVVNKMYDVGFLGATLPEELGGIGGSISTLCVILERICRADSSAGGIIFTNALAQQIMLASGDENLAKKIFPKAKTASDFLVAFPSYTDPAHAPKLPDAVKAGRGYTVTGSLELLVLGSLASKALVPARTKGDTSYSFFLVDLDDAGMEKSEPVFTLGLHACPAVDVTMKGVKAKLIGEQGNGGVYFNKVSSRMNLAAAAMNAGIMKGSLGEAMAYSKERFQGGREIINWSEVSMLLAGMTIKADVAEMCVTQACLALEQGGDNRASACISASLHIHELACEAVTDGVQVLGGNGYMKDYGQEKRYRDARQIQALLGAAPMKKIDLVRGLAGLD